MKFLNGTDDDGIGEATQSWDKPNRVSRQALKDLTSLFGRERQGK